VVPAPLVHFGGVGKQEGDRVGQMMEKASSIEVPHNIHFEREQKAFCPGGWGR
jgi:hypothetical protein